MLDLTGVEFIDSTGLSVLLNGTAPRDPRRGRLAIVCTNPTVLRLFEITRLDTTFDIHATLEDALRDGARRSREHAAGGQLDRRPVGRRAPRAARPCRPRAGRSRAARSIVRPTATAVPLSVCTISGCPPPAGRKRMSRRRAW